MCFIKRLIHLRLWITSSSKIKFQTRFFKNQLQMDRVLGESCQTVQNLDFPGQFSLSKTIWIFLIFCSIELYQCRSPLRFLTTLIFETLYFLKWCTIFDDLALCLFRKGNNDFLWLILGQSNCYLILYKEGCNRSHALNYNLP